MIKEQTSDIYKNIDESTILTERNKIHKLLTIGFYLYKKGKNKMTKQRSGCQVFRVEGMDWLQWDTRKLWGWGKCFISWSHESESRSVVSDSLWPCGLYSSWNSPGQNTGVCSLCLLQGIFLIQELNRGLLHCRKILYQLRATREAPWLHGGYIIIHLSKLIKLHT